MRFKNAVVVIFAVTLCIVSLAMEPFPKSTPSSTAVTPSISMDIRGTESNPIVVSVQPPFSETDDKATNERHRADDAQNNRLIMVFTGGTMVVGFLQLGLFFWQLRLMRSTIQDGALAARAAELNAKAAVGIELPIIRFSPLELVSTTALIPADGAPYGGGITDGPPTRYSALGNFKVTNHGRTPAFPIEFAVGWAVADVLQSEPFYSQRDRVNHAKVVTTSAEQECHLDARHLGIELSEEQITNITAGQSFLWVFGCLYYRDFLDDPREARFCWRYANRNHESMRPFYFFASDGDPPVAYVARR